MIEVNHLTKRYGNHEAVSDLSFKVEKGEIFGFLGPNGAGKSTTMNIMTGCLAATSGEVRIDGYDIFEQPREAKKRIGYLPEIPPLYPDRTPYEYLTFVAEAKGIPHKQVFAQVENAMKITRITDVADRLCKNLSKGYRQRVGIAQALLGDPEVIILDEPTVGLDPKQIIEIRELIRTLGENHTVILSSHILSEVRAVCSRIMIISHGKLAACDTPENLETMYESGAEIDLTVEAGEVDAASLVNSVREISDVTYTAVSDERTEIHLHTASDQSENVCRSLFFAFGYAGYAILQMTTRRASLEEVFIELTGEEPKIQEEIDLSAGETGADDQETDPSGDPLTASEEENTAYTVPGVEMPDPEAERETASSSDEEVKP